MAAAVTGIFNHAMTAGQALTGAPMGSPKGSTIGSTMGSTATPMAVPTAATPNANSTSSSDASSATISANDFLTLLVTEMQNQDPTANTDPNEYINQLVNVNSLEQLIDINQTLSTGLAGSATSKGATGVAHPAAASSALTGPAAAAATAQSSAAPTAAAASPAGAGNFGALAAAAKRAPGNLSVPNANPSASGVAHALDGHIRTMTAGSPAAR